MKLRNWILGLCGCLLFATLAQGQVDLVTVPERRAVQLTIYNSADLTLVRDSRLLTFNQGMNVLQFSWANTLIDASSLELHFRSHEKELQLIDTVYPPQNETALQWNVKSDFAGDAEVEITYFTSGLGWASRYTGHLTANDTKMDLSGDVIVTNNSGEDYPNASVRLIVGTVNLVEQIADLARQRGGWGSVAPELRDHAQRICCESIDKAERELAADAAGEYADGEKLGIVKEGISEYFLFTIDGAVTIPNGWAKSLNSVDAHDVPVEVTFRLYAGWEKLHRYLRFDNRKLPGHDTEDKTNLGVSPLPDGNLYLYRRQDNQDLSFLAVVYVNYIVMQDKCEVDTGEQDEVMVEENIYDYKRDNIVFNGRQELVQFADYTSYRGTLRNTLPFPALVEIERSFDGAATVTGMKYKMETTSDTSFKFYPKLAAGQEEKYEYTVKLHHQYQ